jgi:formylglycine-generating enzyme required for sulfatase activity
MSLSQFLASLGLDAYIEAFEAMGVTLEELPKLSAQTLKADFGMSLVDRKRLLDAIAARGAAAANAAAAEAARVQRARAEAEEAAREQADEAARKAKDEAARKAKLESERQAAEEAERAERAQVEATKREAEAARRKADAERKAREAAKQKADEEIARAKARDTAIRASRTTYTPRVERTREVVESSGFLGMGRRTRAETEVLEASFDMVELPGGTCIVGSPVDDPERAVSMHNRLDGTPKARVNGFAVRPTGGLKGVEAELVPEQLAGSEAQRTVRVAPFAIGVAPVTQALLRLVDPALENNWATGTAASDHPADIVDPELARTICNTLSTALGFTPAYTAAGEAVAGANGFRIPTEAEWVYAARAGEDHRFPGSDNIDAVAWHVGNARGATHPVTKKAPNAWGLHDLTGNVWELTEAGPDPLATKVTYAPPEGKSQRTLDYREVAEEVLLDTETSTHKVRRPGSRTWEDVLDVPEVAWAVWERTFLYNDRPEVPLAKLDSLEEREVRAFELAAKRGDKKARVRWLITPAELPRFMRDSPLVRFTMLTTFLKAGPPAPLPETADAIQRTPAAHAYRGGGVSDDASYARIASSVELWRPDLPRGLRLVRSL